MASVKSEYIIQYTNSITIPASTTKTPSELLATGENIIVMKTNKAKIAIDGGDSFAMNFNETTYGLSTDSTTQILFVDKCTLAIGKLVTIV